MSHAGEGFIQAILLGTQSKVVHVKEQMMEIVTECTNVRTSKPERLVASMQ